MKMDINGAPMATHGLVLSQDGAMPSRMLFILLPGLYEAIFDAFLIGTPITLLSVIGALFVCSSAGFVIFGKSKVVKSE